MTRNSLTYIPGFSVKYFFQPIYTDYANEAYFDKRTHLNLRSNGQLKCHPPFYYFSLAAILVGSRNHPTQIWKRAIQGPFHQSLVAISPVISEEKIKM
jgi:hypothetical protein